MHVISTPIDDLYIIEPKIFRDERGLFFESFNLREFHNLVDSSVEFVQDNISQSRKGVLRGIHYQIDSPQGKLVRVLTGEIFDVAVDQRKDSKTFGKWFGVTLSASNFRQLWVPEGFGHGFLVLSDEADLLYKTTNYYYKNKERCISWNDEKLGIKWPLQNINPIVSEKDAEGMSFTEAMSEV